MTATMDITLDDDGKLQLEDHEGVAAWPKDRHFSSVGHGAHRLEGLEKVTGKAQYTFDVRLPGQLEARVLRSPHPHARIKRIDTSMAEALPGVRAVIHHGNIPRIDWYNGSFIFDPTVRMVGDEVAAVAADTGEIAEDALQTDPGRLRHPPARHSFRGRAQTRRPAGPQRGQSDGRPQGL